MFLILIVIVEQFFLILQFHSRLNSQKRKNVNQKVSLDKKITEKKYNYFYKKGENIAYQNLLITIKKISNVLTFQSVIFFIKIKKDASFITNLSLHFLHFLNLICIMFPDKFFFNYNIFKIYFSKHRLLKYL